MKEFKYVIILAGCFGLFSCKKMINIYPESNVSAGTYYSNLDEVKGGLSGCYNGLQKPIFYEWQMTELRSDNSKQGSPGSTASTNRDLSDLDMFTPSTSHLANYNYWFTTYTNIRNINIVLQKLGVEYNPATGTITLNAITIPVSETDRKQLSGEALFMRAYHYFNLVRLYGGVFLVHRPISPDESKAMNRSPVDDIYKLIIADLQTAVANMNTLKYSQISSNDLGRATGWAAKALLAKVYLTLNRKSDAVLLLQDVKDNSGYGLQSNYASVFAVSNEVNSEILFTIRFKAGGLGLGSLMSNLFAPLGSGSAVIAGDGDGLNYPTNDLDTLTNGDPRKATLIGYYAPGQKLYVKKYIPPQPSTNDDTENDWPVLRYPDVLLMLAEAQGYSQSSLDLINLVRARAGVAIYTMATISNVAQFELALSNERRIEFAFENQRWFDLLRFNTTMTTINAVQAMKDHFTKEYFNHYRLYVAPAPTLQELYDNVSKAGRLLLPIPQREIDTNTQLVITQNPGY